MQNKPFRFGIVISDFPSRNEWITFARRAEELGYSALLMPDRPAMGMQAPLTALAFAAEATTTLRIGGYVFNNENRHPVLLAREIATLDLLSEGRVELGFGPGVSSLDHQQLGLTLDKPGVRVSRFEEALQIIKLMFREETVTFNGEHYTITGFKGLPRSIQKPHPPIFMGCSGNRMLAIAARHADSVAINPRWTKQGIDPDDATSEAIKRKISLLHELAGERFKQIELCQTAYTLAITDSPTTIIPVKGGYTIHQTPMTTSQAVEHLLKLREEYGYSYFQLYDGQMENFAPVLAQLAAHSQNP